MTKKAIKKVSITTIDKIIKENYDNIVETEWYGVDVVISRTLPLKDVLEFVNDVTISCFHDTAGYLPEVKDFLIKSNILTRYANFALPNNLEHQYDIIYNSDAVEFVLGFINDKQISEIVEAIDAKLEYMCNTNVLNIQRQVQKLVDSFENMQEQTSNLFDKVSPEDLVRITAAVGNDGINEEKIVREYLKQTRTMTDESVEE